MINDDQIKDGKRQYDINREVAKYQYYHQEKLMTMNILQVNLTGKDILPSTQKQIIDKAKFTYSPLGNPFEKQTKTVEDQIKK